MVAKEMSVKGTKVDFGGSVGSSHCNSRRRFLKRSSAIVDCARWNKMLERITSLFTLRETRYAHALPCFSSCLTVSANRHCTLGIKNFDLSLHGQEPRDITATDSPYVDIKTEMGSD